ncbi:MAG: hypothetical protein AAGA83_15915 [Cyanobacteria bacterium P01_F01_bin.116]
MGKLLLNWNLCVILAVVAAYLTTPHKALGQTAELGQTQILAQTLEDIEELGEE